MPRQSIRHAQGCNTWIAELGRSCPIQAAGLTMIRTRFGGRRINCGFEKPSLSIQKLPEDWGFPTQS
jgi:hypothetical protein